MYIDDYKSSMKGNIVCPQCNGDVVAKMGFKNVHHFAHKSKTQCDSWTEPMTAWHKGWQDLFEPDNVEVIMTCNGVKHIADVMFKGHILELQHSQLSSAEMMERESFYTTNGKSLTWIVDGHSEKDCVVLGTSCDGYAAIWAKRSWWWHARCMVLIHTSEGLFRVIRYFDKNVGLAIQFMTMTCHDVTGGLANSGAQSLQDMIATRCRRLLSTSFTSACRSSECTICGETYPHKELLKKLGMTWRRDKWETFYTDDYYHYESWKKSYRRVRELWHDIAKDIDYWKQHAVVEAS